MKAQFPRDGCGTRCTKFALEDLKMALQDACSATLLAEFDSITSSDSRHVKLLEGNNQCLEEAGENENITVVGLCVGHERSTYSNTTL